jgi:hypothetical protein
MVAPPPVSYDRDCFSSTNSSFSFALLVKNADLQPAASSLDRKSRRTDPGEAFCAAMPIGRPMLPPSARAGVR